MYFPQITFSRYLAALIVILHHFALVEETEHMPVVGNVLRYANTLLSFFFVLTGFVLIVSLNRNDRMPAAIPLKGLLFHRLTRVLPLHWLALGLMVLMQPRTSPSSPGTFLAHTLLMHAWYPNSSFALTYNFVSWTLSVELLLLVLAPWLYRWMRSQATGPLLVNAGLIWFGSMLLHQICRRLGIPPDWGYFWPPVHVPEFILGLASGFVVVRHMAVLRRYARWLHLLAVLNGLLIVGLLSTGLPFLYRNSLIFAPSYVLILLNTTVYQDSWYTRLFHTRPMRYMGRISYAVYILQLPVSVLILRLLHPWMGWQFRYSGLLFLAVLLLSSIAAYEWIEKPVVARAKRRMQLLAHSQSPDRLATATIDTATA